ncbi:hypothetical protein [Bacillus cereus group sp. N21]|uniref:hypothetical protein n=1 Tax=Bacillus cereus group sp. N21 TaxID=2794591 RepID=UPI0018F67464|nr:hypothetical protein [Bacillus cereus group sp. N21]MBJ8032043.1 hypothetical protein [Bacillus cereus group sp. N21]
MRHTRNRQAILTCKDKKYATSVLKGAKNYTIETMIEESVLEGEIDSTFKWNRNGCKNQYVSWVLPIDIFIEEIAFVKEDRK